MKVKHNYFLFEALNYTPSKMRYLEPKYQHFNLIGYII